MPLYSFLHPGQSIPFRNFSEHINPLVQCVWARIQLLRLFQTGECASPGWRLGLNNPMSSSIVIMCSVIDSIFPQWWQWCTQKGTQSCFIAHIKLLSKKQIGRKNTYFNVITDYQVSAYKVLCTCVKHLTYMISFDHQHNPIRYSYFPTIQRG